MKRIYYLLSLAMVALVACTHEEEDLFGDSSANRADAAINTYIEVLASPSNGWLMEYFPASTREYGGYNILLAFDKEGAVRVAGEIANPSDVATSLYAVKQSAGIVLSFDMYNTLFHFFSDPSDPSGIGGTGFGLEGDFEFLVLEASAEKVILKGKKTGGLAVLTPIQESWSDYITAVQDLEAATVFPEFKVELNGETIPVTISYRTLTFTYEEDGDTKSQTASYIVTKTGYKFYEPVVIKGVTLSGFTFDAGDQLFTETGNVNIKLIPVFPPINKQFVTGNWFIALSTAGPFATAYFNYVKGQYSTNSNIQGEVLQYAFMGSLLYGAFGFNFSSSGYTGLLTYNYTLIGEDKISLVFAMSGQGDGVWYHNYAGFSYFLNPFGYSAARIFTLTTDDLKSPTYVILTEDANANNVIKLHKTPVYYPFDN
ncbi:MAG: DUF4302 domain-containing protein [Mediterranea sp.]|nr:DUF4302 domain-containing protein [Mediterranea sp.]